jgi:hypothetical protein
MPKRPRPRRVLGVDFSGASDAGRKIWVAECERRRGNRLTLHDLRPACDLPNGGGDPATAIAALAETIVKEPDTIAGCDFPFSLPKTLIDESTWETFATAFPARFPDPEAFRNGLMRRSDGREIRRDCDKAAKTPFNSYNLRIYRQTWWGIAHLLGPLLVSRRAVIRPYQPMPAKPVPIVIEACPACSLKGIGFYPAYKGRSGKHRLERKAVLRKLIALGLLEPPALSIQRTMLDNAGGDALDAVIAALAAAHADVETETNPDLRIEGTIYSALSLPIRR